MLSPSIVDGPRRGRFGAAIRGNRDSARNRAENPDGCADRYTEAHRRGILARWLPRRFRCICISDIYGRNYHAVIYVSNSLYIIIYYKIFYIVLCIYTIY